MSYKYDVAVSFAGEDRAKVEEFVGLLLKKDVRIFYDVWETSDLWGKDLYQYLDDVYRNAARFCVVFISSHYVKKAWTKHELRSAQARAFVQNEEYILPVRLDDTEVPGLPDTMAFIDARQMSAEEIVDILLKKLGYGDSLRSISDMLKSPDSKVRGSALSTIAVGRLDRWTDETIHKLLNDPSNEVRERAAWALDNLKVSVAIPALLQAIGDPVWSVRSNAGWALVHLGEAAKEPVSGILHNSDNSDAREMAKLILDRL